MKETTIELEEASHVLKLLGDKTRLTLVGLMHHHECCVCEFVEILEMSQPAVSQHLRKLKDAGLVKENRRGQWIFYSLNKETKAYPLIQDIISHIPDQNNKLEALITAGKRIICD